MQEVIIILNALAYVATTLFFFKREGLTIRTFLWGYVSLFTLGSVYLLSSGLYFIVMDNPDFERDEEIPFLPYILNYFFCFMVLSVTSRINISNIRNRFIYNKTTKYVNIVLIFIEILYFIIKLGQAFLVFAYGFGNFHELGEDLQNEYLYGGMPWLQYVNFLGKFVNLVVMPYVILHQFYGYKQKKVSMQSFFSIAVLYCLNTLIVGVVSGSRATMMFGLLNILFFVVLLYRFLNKTVIRKIYLVGFGMFLLLVFVTQSITKERLAYNKGEMTTSENVARYLGEAQLNLTYEYYNHLLKHTGGRYVFSGFYNDKRDLLTEMGTHPEWFKTAYGCFYVDFGLFLPMIICALFVLLFRRIIPRSRQSTKDFSMCFFYYTICCWLPFNYFLEPFDLFIFFSLMVVPLYLKKVFEKNKNYEKKY